MKKLTREKQREKKTWYCKGKYKSVFYVDATPNSLLAKQCQQVLDKCDVPIKVMEKTGKAICNLLVKSNPFKHKNCNDPKCAICLYDSKINAEPATLSLKITMNTMQFVKEHKSEKPQIRSKSDFLNTLMTTDYVHKNQQCMHILSKSITGKKLVLRWRYKVSAKEIHCWCNVWKRYSIVIQNLAWMAVKNGETSVTHQGQYIQKPLHQRNTLQGVNQSDDVATSIITDVK